MSGTVLKKVSTFQRACVHNQYIVDPKLNTVDCGICGKELNPMWVLEQLCNQEGRAYQRLQHLKEEAAKAEQKNRCKCEKCGEMTRISR